MKSLCLIYHARFLFEISKLNPVIILPLCLFCGGHIKTDQCFLYLKNSPSLDLENSANKLKDTPWAPTLLFLCARTYMHTRVTQYTITLCVSKHCTIYWTLLLVLFLGWQKLHLHHYYWSVGFGELMLFQHSCTHLQPEQKSSPPQLA